MSGKVIHIPEKLWGLIIRAGIIFFVCCIIGLIINLFSPSAALTLDAEERLEFWIILCLVGGIGIFISDMVLTLLGVTWPELFKALIQSIAGMIAVLIPLFRIYGPEDLPSYPTTIMLVWAIMILIVAGVLIFSKQLRIFQQDRGLENHSIAENAAPKILSRLPIHMKTAELYALSAEDHYVRIHTSKGEEMVLMRLSDAIEEVGIIPGMQTHRSWWVAASAVDNIQSKGRGAEVKLPNGTQVPVSRNALKSLRAAGWL